MPAGRNSLENCDRGEQVEPECTISYEDPPLRRFALGDIHGCSRTIRKMVEDVLRLAPDDTLFMLGDYTGMKLIGEQEKIIMRNPDRIPVILAAIQKSWEANPDLRLMQLLLNAIDFQNPCSELYHLEDAVLMSRLLGDVK